MATSKSSGKRLRLTVFLIKETYSAVEDFVSVAPLNEVAVASGASKRTLYFKSGFKSQPPLAAIFAGVPAFNRLCQPLEYSMTRGPTAILRFTRAPETAIRSPAGTCIVRPSM